MAIKLSPPPTLITLKEAAQMMGVGRTAMYYRIKKHGLNSCKIGQNHYLWRHEVEAVIAIRKGD